MTGRSIDPVTPSRAVQRVIDALAAHAPSGVQIETGAGSWADVQVLHVVGRHDRVLAQARAIKALGGRYAVVQYALRSTQRPSTSAWVDLWNGAAVVWSYYDLPRLCREDGVRAAFRFYRAPLGVADVFSQVGHADRPYAVVTSGRGWLTESVRECVAAARAVGRGVVHLGESMASHGVDSYDRLSDQDVALLYSRSEFASGLRRIEGFELPAAEGLCCGARPVLFDAEHYRHWFDGLAEFVPETDRAGVIERLTALFRRGAQPVTEAEMAEARRRFDWRRIVGGFWECVA